MSTPSGDGAALLRAIIDNPDEDTPRLVYADWSERARLRLAANEFSLSSSHPMGCQ